MEKRKKLDSIIKLVSSLGWKIIRASSLSMPSHYEKTCFLIGEEEEVDKVLEIINKPAVIIKDKEKLSIGWIQEYRDLFPIGVKSGGFPVRGDLKGCTKKMERFLEDYPEYDKEIILKATKSYVDKKRLENYAYMQLAHYFIKKDDISSLAAECENLRESIEHKETILNI